MRKKVKLNHVREVVYSEEEWKRLSSLREKALRVMKRIQDFSPLAYGSLARGDVHRKSDIDLVILYSVPSYLLELRLSELGVVQRKVCQATPWSVVKGHILLQDMEISFPLVSPKKIEKEFYRFGGFLDIMGLENKKRVSGVDKRLCLIEPTKRGHRETSILGREGEIAKLLGISLNVVSERVKVLQKRDRIGRTGIFVNRVL
ncbi:MAG: nucleotidyltransferase domain-containing protein, partial [Candidatus Methanofastidiosia archaeon]